MSTYVVTKVRKERAADGSHEHIEGVCTAGNAHYTRAEVAQSIKAGNAWHTSADGYSATIEVINYCPRAGCLASPYLRTNPDKTTKDNLENLDRC
jgi:hypothetical protein